MKKLLIANRGEIAVRIARACADHGVQSVAVYADADLNALHVRMADEAYGLEGNKPADTYLNIAKLLAVAERSGADAVHPGYGFLSESAAFAQAVIDAGLTWVGPSPAAIAMLGDKVQARKLAMKVGAPLVAGTADPVKNAGEVLAFAEKHGLPVAIKAAFGGGGRGIKVAWRLDEVEGLYESAVREAVTAFGRGECYVEQFLDRPRHVEAQVLADTHGNVVVLGTRDCSLQRDRVGLVDLWLRHVQDVHVKHLDRVDLLPPELRHDRLCELNTIEQVVNVCQTIVVQDAWKRGQQLTVHGWVYGLKNGLIRDLGINVGRRDDLMPRYLSALEALPN